MSEGDATGAGPLRPDDPAEVGPYRLLGRLGTGRLGVTYLARSAEGRAVALRVVEERLARDAAFRARLGETVEAARRVEPGPLLVPFVDANTGGADAADGDGGDAGAPLWLATAYVEAPSLARLVAERGPLPAEAARETATALATALATLHDAGLTHGALTPSAVLMTEDGPRLVDFGLAHVPRPESASLGDPLLGDPDYLSPERLLGLPETEASDVCTLGAVLHFAAVGRPPYELGDLGGTGSAYQRAVATQRIVHERPDHAAVPDPALRALIAACTDRNPTARPSAAGLPRLLEQPVPAAPPPPAPPPGHPPVSATARAATVTAPAVGPPPAAPPPFPAGPGGPPPGAKPRAVGGGRRTGLAVLAGVLCLALVVVAVVLVSQGSDSDPSASPSGDSTTDGQGGGVAPNGKLGFTWGLTATDAARAVGGDDSYARFVGVWRTDSSVVLGTSEGMTAHDPATGEVLWSWQPPDDGLVCSMSHRTSEDVGAFTYGVFNSEVGGIEQCHQLQTIALDSGEAVWDSPVSLTGEGATGFPNLTGGYALSIGDGVVSAAYAGPATTADHGTTDLVAVDAETGEVRWTTDLGGEAMPDGCRLSGFAQALADVVYAVANCEDDAAPQLLAFDDPTSAEPQRIPAGLTGCAPMSNDLVTGLMTAGQDHLVVGCQWNESASSALYAYTPGVGLPMLVDMTGVSADALNDEFNPSHTPGNLLVDGGTLYVPHGEEVVTGGGPSDGVVAIDLTTGQQLWSYTHDGSTSTTLLTATDSGVEIIAERDGAPPSLYLVNEEGPLEGTPLKEQADALLSGTSAPLGVHTGEHLAIAFPDAFSDDDPMLGVMPSAARDEER
ncbi:protein kinase domain-containing protein [Streptomyces sp. 4N509B]|uniref:protein kinase domain-containing protein n=1 Tax=Streptomyces sp. 4N509B TaxID=3457413 RepID=UPI003FCEF2D0